MTTPPSGRRPRGRDERKLLREVRRRYQLEEAPAPAAVAAPVRQPTSRGNRGVRRRHPVRRLILLLCALLVAGAGIFGYRILAASNKISVAEESILGQLKDLLFASGNILNGEEEGRINMLLIAVGGEGHSGATLADTIMVASVRPKDGDVALLSIPRDLFVQVPGQEYYTKINTVHALGESQKENRGPELLQEKVEEITGQPIHYYARIDFTAFKSIVDSVGGINVTIENEFLDYWHNISFPAGTEKMNGERALAYVRARYVEGPEGGDFKRAARQQQALLSLRDKVFSVNTAFDFGAVNSIMESLSDNIRTDMQLWEMKRFFELARLIDHSKVHSIVLTTGHNGVLVGSTEILEGQPASILKTRTGDYSEIQAMSANIFSDDVGRLLSPTNGPATQAEEPDAKPSPSPEEEEVAAKPTVEIRNGTNVNGLAAKTRDQLVAEGYEVAAIGNAANRSTPTTTVYQISNTAADGALELAEFLEVSSETGLPEGEADSEAHVVIILGGDKAP